jgi:hypothetical protein
MSSTLAALDPVLARTLTSVVSLVLLVGASQKLRQWQTFRAALANYRLLPDALVAPAALCLPALEMIAGIALLADPFRAAGSALSVAVLLAVTGAVAINLSRGRVDIDCGCGGPEGRQRLSWALVARNAALVLAAAVGAQEGAARDLHWIDYGTIAFGTIALYGLYACTNQLLANRTGLYELRSRT